MRLPDGPDWRTEMIWVSVLDHLPPIDEPILWLTVDGNFFVEYLDKDSDPSEITHLVTHWARIPYPEDV